MSQVFVLDTTKQPLSPVHAGRARLLLTQGQAAVYRRYPFTIILKTALAAPSLPSLHLKIDPGARTSGLAVVNDATGEVVWAAEPTHRGAAIKRRMDTRRSLRRSRRSRRTRYRQARFKNRRRRSGLLPPSLESRVATILTWVTRLRHLCRIGALSQEVVRFDLQRLQHPALEGVEYQQGTLAGYEVKEYLLERWQRTCAYCVTPVKGHHFSGEQSLASYGNGSMLNVSLTTERQVRTIV